MQSLRCSRRSNRANDDRIRLPIVASPLSESGCRRWGGCRYRPVFAFAWGETSGAVLRGSGLRVGGTGRKLEQFVDDLPLGEHFHRTSLHDEFLVRIKPQRVIDRCHKVRDRDGAFRRDGSELVAGTNHQTCLHATATEGQAETTPPVIAAGAFLVVVELWGPP